MKMTIDIPDGLLEEARNVARRDHITFNALIEQGLRHVIAERTGRSGFSLRKVTFRGQGLNPRLAGDSWEKIRQLSYGCCDG